MKIFLIILILILSPSLTNAQVVKFQIEGEVIDTINYKAAYLTTLSQQRTISSDKVFLMVNIKNGKFKFTGEFDLNGEFYQNACLFFDKRNNITKQEVASKFHNLIWVVGREDNLKHIVLENMSIKFSKGSVKDNMLIVNNGCFTQQIHAMSEMRKQLKGFQSFIAKFPDSPVSFYSLNGIYQAYIDKNKQKLEYSLGKPYEMYDLLSERIKNSDKGKELKKNMDAFFDNIK